MSVGRTDSIDPYEGIVRQNIEPDFDRLLKNELRRYVYALGGPAPSDIFYIGKAGGNEAGEGNERVLDHFKDAQKVIDSKGHKTPSRKEARILEAWRDGKSVHWSILRHGLATAEDAHHVEATLIDVFGLTQLTNERRESTKHGKLTVPQLQDMAAPPVQASQTYPLVLLFNITKSARRGTPYYEATRAAWSMGPEFRAPGTLAIGIIDGISYAVFKVTEWTDAPNEATKKQFTANELLNHDLLKRNFSAVIAKSKGPWMRGQPFGIELRPGAFRFKKGAIDKETWHPLPPVPQAQEEQQPQP